MKTNFSPVVGTLVLIVLGVIVTVAIPQRGGPQPPSITPLPAKTVTSPSQTISTVDWKTYRNEMYQYAIKYPQNSKVVQEEGITRISLPFIKRAASASGLELLEKFVVISVKNNGSLETCRNPQDTIVKETTHQQIGGVNFLKEMGSENTAGHIYYTASFSATLREKCFGISFVLNYGNHDGSELAVKATAEEELRIIEPMISTFALI